VPSAPSQFRLLAERRFLPYFASQSLGAFNDNLLKNGLVLLATFSTGLQAEIAPELLANLAGGLFILPFLLFSGLAGQLADRYDKALILKIVKAAEIAIMALAGWGFAQGNLLMLLASLFLMGLHSTFFAPAKYGLLPQVLRSEELVGGNALVETGTFLAILGGTLTAGLLVADGHAAQVSQALMLAAVLGFAASLAIPALPARAPGSRIDWNPWTSTLDNLRAAKQSRTVLLSLLGLSWFWFYGALVLAQLPLYTQTVLGGDAGVVTLLLVVFSVGIGAGSLLCEKLSDHRVEIGLVPFGSLGLTGFALDLAFASPDSPAATMIGPAQFMAQEGSWRILFDLAGLGVFGGFFVVPLYALVQQRAKPELLSRVIGANSILNALFMVAASLFGALMLARGVSVVELLAVTAVLNAVVALYIYGLVPEFLLRFLAWVLIRPIYRLRTAGLENIPERGPALLICNHISFVDPIVISAAVRRPIRFIMEHTIFEIPVMKTIFRGMKAIPVAPQKENPEVYERAFEVVAAELRAGQLVCIFPEGRLTRDGEIEPFRAGMLRILQETPVPVIPMALSGLWGSMFSRYSRTWWRRLPRRLFARIELAAGVPVPPEAASLEHLQAMVAALRTRP